jgi:IS4 transposase
MAFAQLTYRESLRDIEACLRSMQSKLYHMGIRGRISRSTPYTLLDLKINILPFVEITDEKLHDVNILDELIPEPGSFYIMDRAYVDFLRLHILTQCLAFFVIRAKTNLQFRRVYSHPIDKSTGLKCDQPIVLTGINSAQDYPDKLRRIRYYDQDNDLNLTFLTNNFTLPALTIAQLYKCRWRIELFFKWIKQHLRRIVFQMDQTTFAYKIIQWYIIK